MGAPVPLDKLPPSLRGTAVPADKLPPQLAAPPAAPPAAAAPPPSYPLSGVGINQPADIPGVGLLVNAGEGLWNAGAKAASGYAGLLGTMLPGPEGQGADWQQRTNETLRTDFTPNKDPLVNLPAMSVSGYSQLLDMTPAGPAFNNFVENTPGAKEALEGGMDIATLLGVAAPMSAARAGVVADRAAIADSTKLLGNRKGAPTPGTAVAGPGDNTYLASPAAEASRAGINVTPYEVERQVAGSGESVKGSTRAGFGTGAVNKETAMGNAPRINEIAIRGMPEGVRLDPRNGRIEPQVIEGAKNVERAKYDAVRGVPGDGTSLEMQHGLADVARGLENVPESVANDVTRIIRSRAAGGTSTKLVDDIMELRQEATMDGKRAFNQNDPTARQLAGYKRQVADQLEEELMRRGEAAGLQGVRETLKEARTNFAKLATLEEATDQGFVDAARLEKVTEGGGYLSDGMADVARHNQAAPISMTHPQRIGPQAEPNMRAGASPTDMALRSAQFIGGNWLTKQIGKGGVNALNEELRGFAPPPKAPPMERPTFDFERAPEQMGPPFPTGAQSPVAPPAPNSAPLGAFDLQGARFADELQNLQLVDPMTGQVPGAGMRAFQQAPDTIPWDPVPPAGPVSPAATSFADQLGPTRGLIEVPAGPGMLDQPRGVTGPRSAQLSDPRLAEDLQVGDVPPPRAPKFGPGDEFPEKMGAPESPAGEGSISDELSLAPDNGPARSRVDVTENGPAAAEGKFKDHSLVAGAERIESESGFVDVLKNPDRWEIKQTFTDPAFRRQGLAEKRLAETAAKAQAEGVDLVSDKSVHPDVLKMYRKARDNGLITFNEANPKRVDEAIAANSPARSDVPIFQNIRPAGGDVSAELGK